MPSGSDYESDYETDSQAETDSQYSEDYDRSSTHMSRSSTDPSFNLKKKKDKRRMIGDAGRSYTSPDESRLAQKHKQVRAAVGLRLGL